MKPSRHIETSNRRVTGDDWPRSRIQKLPSLDYVDIMPSAEPEHLVYGARLERELRSLAERLRSGASPPRVLLFGEPGLGKTATLRQLQATTERPFWWVRSERLFSSFLGGTSSNLAAIFRDAEVASASLVFDDFEVIARRRDDPRESGESRRLVAALISNLDAYANRVPVLAATNLPNVLDPAVLRRFRDLLPFEMLDIVRTRQLLKERFLLRRVTPVLLRAAQMLSPAEIADVATACNGDRQDTAHVRDAFLRRRRALKLAKKQNG